MIRPMFRFVSIALATAMMVSPVKAEEIAVNQVPFGAWVDELKREAGAQGVSELLLKRAFAGVTPNQRVIELDRKQPEGTTTFTSYLRRVVDKSRIAKGQKKYREHKELIDKIAAEYGVQSRFIVALWGIETNYGGYTGNMSVIRSLATLAYDGRRSEFFRKELLNALKIIDDGHIALDDMDGSWAGAMGQCQFMPSSFISYAVDYNGDGRKDIWDTKEDVFASIANYLKQSGWSDDLTWGRQVKLPADLDEALTDGKQYKPLSEWQALGVRKANGADLPDRQIEAALTLPGKPHEAAYLVYRNYDVVLKWNRSRYFATAVGTLSDAIR